MLDAYSHSVESVDKYPHIHCWHTDNIFSKFQCFDGNYDHMSDDNLNLGVINEYCLSMALRARRRVLGTSGRWSV